MYFSYSCLSNRKTKSFSYATTEDSLVVMGAEYLPKFKDAKGVANAHESEVIVDDVVEYDFEKIGSEYQLVYNNSSGEEQSAILPIYAYLYVKAFDEDDKNVEVIHSEESLVEVKLPANTEGKITIKFESPTIWRMAEGISVITLVACCICYVRFAKPSAFRAPRGGHSMSQISK